MEFEDDDFWRLYEHNADHWRLSESLSVTNAAMLAAGIDPGSTESTDPDAPHHGHFHRRGASNGVKNYTQSGSFIAVFSAIRNAILEDRIRANITHLARNASYVWYGSDAVPEAPRDDETEVPYTALFRTEGMSIKTNAGNRFWEQYSKIYIIKEPAWSQTTVMVEDLREWMASRNFLPPFFFPEVKPQEFMDKEHKRYSAKLAAAVSAWEAIQEAAPNRTVKQTLERWLNANAAAFGLIDDDGRPRSTVVESLSEVANWETRGGAPKTSAPKDEIQQVERKPISNFHALIAPSMPPDDSEIPF
ncbi:hypothetical protein LX70_01670 [Defluviimonas denitrificans]|jgi:hypothetical protein|uniref:Uncharacterized protein n=1 Tax=Albidovulum denitrificans TaxID=404881 RepID=A0A2S8SAJ5_9RHOB|nr:hypothetical protein [Defluviimonas denitrificans]PQV57861.1 hypothetical protein LX70_01670 [Defluviimonas denitrificans]